MNEVFLKDLRILFEDIESNTNHKISKFYLEHKDMKDNYSIKLVGRIYNFFVNPQEKNEVFINSDEEETPLFEDLRNK